MDIGEENGIFFDFWINGIGESADFHAFSAGECDAGQICLILAYFMSEHPALRL